MPTSPVAQFMQTSYLTQTGTAYPLAIDANMAVAARVVAPFSPYPTSPASMNVNLAAGALFVAGALIEVATQTVTISAAPTSNSRIDRIVINQQTGAASLVTGTVAANPSPPPFPAGVFPVAQVSVANGVVAITAAMIADERVPFVGSTVLRTTIDGPVSNQERLEFKAAGTAKWTILRDTNDALKIINEMLGAEAFTFDPSTNKANFLQPPMIGGIPLASMLGGLKNARLITASGSVTPTSGSTKWLGFLVGGANDGQASSGSNAAMGVPGGAGCAFFASVSDATAYSVVIGGKGGNSSVTVGSTTYTAQGNGGSASGGFLNISGALGGDATVTNSNNGQTALGGFGGDGPFGFGHGGSGAMVTNWTGFVSKPGLNATGYGAAGGGASGLGGSAAGGSGTPGCLLLLEF